MWFRINAIIALLKSCWQGQTEAKMRVDKRMRVFEEGQQFPDCNQYQKAW